MDLLQLLLEDLAARYGEDRCRLLHKIQEELELTERQAEAYIKRYKLCSPQFLDKGY